MTAAEIVRTVLGNVTFEVAGTQTEAFLTDVMAEGESVWALQKRDGVTLRLKCRTSDFARLAAVAAKCHCEVRQVSENGLPKHLRRYKHRYGFAVGAALFLACLVWMGAYVWSVEVETNLPEAQKQEIIDLLAQNGCKIGTPLARIDASALRLALLSQSDAYATVTVAVEGTKVTCEVSSLSASPRVITRFMPCNVVAKCDGIVKSVRAYNGVSYVKKGDAVTEGQLLVGGVYDSKVLGYRTVHASAEIIAETVRTVSVTVYKADAETVHTGRESGYAYVEILGHRIPLCFGTESPYQTYTVYEDARVLALNDTTPLPITVGRVTYCETERIDLDGEALEAYAQNVLDERVRIAVGGDTIISREQSITKDNESITLTARVTVSTDIAKEQEIYDE